LSSKVDQIARASNNVDTAAMSDAFAMLEQQRKRTKMILQVHDELVFEVPDEELEWAQHEVPTLMSGVAQLSVPLLAEVGVGANWDEAH